MALALLSTIALALVSLASALFTSESKKAATACMGTAAVSLIGSASIIFPVPYLNDSITFQTNIPAIAFSFGIDPLSRFFLIVIFGISILISFYGLDYIKGQRKLAPTAPFFPLLVAAMSGVVLSRDGFSFLILWELMSLSSFFLVTAEHENKEAQNAGWIYLIATHIAGVFLMAFFAILAKNSGSFLFSGFASTSSLLFIFAVIGFGTKAGIFPFHIWLPHAHPSAPSYISALMSGVMIKLGIYGILRALTFFGTPPIWWGWLLIVAGILSAVIGILYALMQADLKKLLAYCSVENIGVIVIGVGVGLVGKSYGNPLITVLGFGGALFHVLNHAIFKSLLFLCAGNLLHIIHPLSVDRLGGLIKKLPATGLLFLIASISICSLPPFNGFISEWIIYTGLFNGALSFSGYPILLSIAGILGIAFAGGLAIACFTKAFSAIFLGTARNEMPLDCHEPSLLSILPMSILAAFCVAIGLFPKFAWHFILKAIEPLSRSVQIAETGQILLSLNWISILFVALIFLVLILLFIRNLILRKREVSKTVTWDCGYASPTSRMQYTASSFAEPISSFLKFKDEIRDIAEERIFNPLFENIGSLLLIIKNKKKSTVQSYLALIFITLTALFVWEVWFGI